MEINIFDTILFIVIITIVVIQIRLFSINMSKICILKNIFPSTEKNNLKLVIDNDITTIVKDSQTTEWSSKISQSNKSNKKEDVFSKVIDTLNKYLIENKGAVSDFHLIKDVVERNCDSIEEEITTLTPMPLYLGLIGTMIGILVGVGSLVLTGGLNALLSIDTENQAGNGIVELLGGVALAMISSIFGILFTTFSSWYTKGAKRKMDIGRNEFLSWIQINLLPSLNDSATSAIHTLQSNLTDFNKTFSVNIKDMQKAFNNISNAYSDQVNLINMLENLDVKKMATANVKVLKELKETTSEFERFNEHIHNVSSYIERVNKLNEKLNDHLDRTRAIEKMGVFFENEIEQFGARKGYINATVGEIDDNLKKALDELSTNATEQLTVFTQNTVELTQKFNSAIQEQESLMKGRLQETSDLLREMKNISDVKNSMTQLVSLAQQQDQNFKKLVTALNNIVQSDYDIEDNSGRFISKGLKATIITTCIIVIMAALLYIAFEVIGVIKDYKQNQQNLSQTETATTVVVIDKKTLKI